MVPHRGNGAARDESGPSGVLDAMEARPSPWLDGSGAHADIVLHTMAKETRFRTEAMTSRIAQHAIVDALIQNPATSSPREQAAAIRKAREAALADPEGKALGSALGKPVVWLKPVART